MSLCGPQKFIRRNLLNGHRFQRWFCAPPHHGFLWENILPKQILALELVLGAKSPIRNAGEGHPAIKEKNPPEG